MTEALLVAFVAWLLVQYVAWPLLDHATPMLRPQSDDLAFDRREALVTSLREVELDRAMGKLSESEHARLRADLNREAIGLARELNAADTPANAHTPAE